MIRKVYLLQVILIIALLIIGGEIYDQVATYSAMHINLRLLVIVDAILWLLFGIILSLPMLKPRGKFRPQPLLCLLALALLVFLLFKSIDLFYEQRVYHSLLIVLGVLLPLGLFFPRMERIAPPTAEASPVVKETPAPEESSLLNQDADSDNN